MTLGRWMKCSLLLSLFSLETNAQIQSPIISLERGNPVLKLSKEMQGSLQKFNPAFRTWQSADYSTRVRTAPIEDSVQIRVPFALVVDANKDGRPDIILDGHDDNHCLLLCLLSDKQGYIVKILRTGDLVVPSEIVDFDGGVEKKGLCCYLSATCVWTSEKHFDPKKTFVFQIVSAQRSDSTGKLVNDGGSISYYFENGEFIEGYFDPL